MDPARAAPFEDLIDLTRRTKRQVEATLRRYHIPQQDWGDLVQDSLVVLMGREHSVTNLDAWFLAILRNKCLHSLRRQRTRLYDAVDRGVLELIRDTRTSEPDTQYEVSRLRDAISSLHEKCRQALTLRYFQGRSGREIAASLGCTPVSARKVTERCLGALTRRFASPGTTEA